MNNDDKNTERREIEQLRRRVAELEELQDAHTEIEKKLMHCAERYRTLFENASDAIFVLEVENNRQFSPFVEVNAGACRLLGYTRDELKTLRLDDIIPRESAETCNKLMARLLSEKYLTLETEIVKKDGTKIPVELSCHVFEVEDRVTTIAIARDVTVYRQTRERLDEEIKKRTDESIQSERRYRALYDRSLLCVYVHDLEGHFIDANDAALSLMGYTREEITSVHLANILDEEQLARAFGAIKEIVDCGYQKNLTQYRLTTKGGEAVWVETETVLLLRDGEPYAVQGIARDITKRKQVEEQLKNAEAEKDLVLESILENVIYHDLNMKVLWANRSAARTVNMIPEQLVGKYCYRVWQQRESVCPGCPVERAMKTGQMQMGENITPDGRIWLLRGYPVRDDRGKIKGAVEVTLDITVIKQADEALRQSEERYKTLTENINVGIYRNTVGPKGKFIEANPALIKMFGYHSKDEFLTKDVADLYQNAEDRKKFNEKMLSKSFVREEELDLKKKDGSPFLGSVSAVVVKDEAGRVKYFDGIIEDITERKHAEQQLKESYEKLARVLNGTVHALASTTEKRDPYTAGHQHRVAQLACAIAREMNLSEELIEGLRVAGIVHDIGKIYVAAEILNKPVKLKDIEMELIKAHCEAGYEILKTVDFPWPVADMVLQHHEKVNGSGYPRGLKGGEIILGARILAVADVVEAMVSHRPYRSALSIEEAIKEIKDNRGILYDPDVVEACILLFGRGFTFK